MRCGKAESSGPLAFARADTCFNNPQAIEEAEQNIQDAVAAISADIDEATQKNNILSRVFQNFERCLAVHTNGDVDHIEIKMRFHVKVQPCGGF